MNSAKKMLIVGGVLGGLAIPYLSSQKDANQERISKILSLSEKSPDGELEKLRIAELEGSPLWGEKRMITPNYGNLLGFSQAETIMRSYNGFPVGSEFSSKNLVNSEENMTFPLIYPELMAFLPDQWEELAKTSVFEKYKDIKAAHLIVVTKCGNGKHALAYYEGGRLKMATYVSIGTSNHKTLSGKYELTHDAVFRRSRKYRNAPMPYSLHISGGYFLHQGQSDGIPKSHGCIRVPGLYQRRIYNQLPRSDGKQKAVIILDGLYET